MFQHAAVQFAFVFLCVSQVYFEVCTLRVHYYSPYAAPAICLITFQSPLYVTVTHPHTCTHTHTHTVHCVNGYLVFGTPILASFLSSPLSYLCLSLSHYSLFFSLLISIFAYPLLLSLRLLYLSLFLTKKHNLAAWNEIRMYTCNEKV